MATVMMPSSVAARNTRIAISDRFATSSRLICLLATTRPLMLPETISTQPKHAGYRLVAAPRGWRFKRGPSEHFGIVQQPGELPSPGRRHSKCLKTDRVGEGGYAELVRDGCV